MLYWIYKQTFIVYIEIVEKLTFQAKCPIFVIFREMPTSGGSERRVDFSFHLQFLHYYIVVTP